MTPTAPDEGQPDSPPADSPPSTGPSMNPRPGPLALAGFLAVGMIFVIYLDSQSETYDGKIAVAIIAALIAGILGFDLSKFFRGGGGT